MNREFRAIGLQRMQQAAKDRMDRALQRIAAMGPDKKLNLGGLLLDELPPLPDDVRELKCDRNRLQLLPPLPKTLTHLICSQNVLTALPEQLPPKLKVLNCSYNQIFRLPELPNDLEELSCTQNEVRDLPCLPNKLKVLSCTLNHLTYIPPLPDTLEELFCSNNALTKLPTLPSQLRRLYCDSNRLTIIPRLPITLQNGLFYSNPFKEPFRTIHRQFMEDINEFDFTPEGMNDFIRLVNEAHDLAAKGRNLSSFTKTLSLAAPSSAIKNVLAMEYGPKSNIASYITGESGSIEQQMKKLRNQYEQLGEHDVNIGPLPYGPSEKNFSGGKKRKTRRKQKKRKTRKV